MINQHCEGKRAALKPLSEFTTYTHEDGELVLQGSEDMQMLALLHQAQVQHAASGALQDMDSRTEVMEAEIERQQEIGLQV